MASTINASTSSGLVQSGDTSGVLQLQTNSGQTAVTIDTSQNVGIGTSSPGFPLDVKGQTKIGQSVDNATISGTTNFFIQRQANDSRMQMGFATTPDAWCINTSYGSTGAIKPLVLAVGDAERMRIDTAGNVGIGTASATYKLEVYSGSTTKASLYQSTGTNTYTPTASTSIANTTLTLVGGNASGATTGIRISQGSNFELYLGGVQEAGGAAAFVVQGYSGSAYAERMRIDSSGNVLVGKTSASSSSLGFEARPTGEVNTGSSASANTTTVWNTYSTGAAAYRFYVGMGGTVYATSTTISAISDKRFKENIQDLDVGLDAVMSLKPRKFDWKEGKGKDIKGDRGFIAQEFEQVFPDLIDEWKDPAPEGEEPYKSVRQDLIPVLVKAIQEQQTIINDLKARITALEGAK